MKKNYRNLILFLISALFCSCANQLPPGGGPKDLTPPEIVYAYPANGTVNFTDDYIELEFSEYVDKRSVQDAVFISPSVNDALEYDWSGKKLRINFTEKLKAEMTYIVTIGTNTSDLNNHNKMSQAYSIAFSTGSKIDRGIIQGTVFTDKPQGIMMYAYQVGDSIINPTKQKPKYISQAGAKGEYKLPGLAFGLYRVFAFQDDYSDLIYNVGDDIYGCPYSDVSISEEDSVFHNLNFFLSKEDTLKPRLINAAMTDRYHLLLEFSEGIDSTFIKSGNFVVIDSTTKKEYHPVFSFQGKKKETIVLVTKDSLSDKDNNYVKALNIKDKTGNISLFDNAQLVVSNKADTSAPNLYSSKDIFQTDDEKVYHDYIFYFDDGFDSTQAKKGISVSERKGKIISSKVTFIDDASFKVNILDELKPIENYTINIDLNYIIDASGNKRDSVFKYSITQTPLTDVSAVSGSVKLPENLKKEKIMVVLQGTDESKVKYQKKVDNKRAYKFNKVKPGKYIMWSYIDKDSSQTYNYGKPFPFTPSEKFVFYPDTLKLRARWPVEDVNLEYK